MTWCDGDRSLAARAISALARSKLVRGGGGGGSDLDRLVGTGGELTTAGRTTARLAADGDLTPLHQVRVQPGRQIGQQVGLANSGLGLGTLDYD